MFNLDLITASLAVKSRPLVLKKSIYHYLSPIAPFVHWLEIIPEVTGDDTVSYVWIGRTDNMAKAHTEAWPAKPSLLLLVVLHCWSHCQPVTVLWGSCECHWTLPQVPQVVWVPLVEKYCSWTSASVISLPLDTTQDASFAVCKPIWPSSHIYDRHACTPFLETARDYVSGNVFHVPKTEFYKNRPFSF